MTKKNYSKTGKRCRVTFKIPADRIPAQLDADEAVLLGDFNGWRPDAHPLTRRKDGSFSTTVSLDAGSTYRFRYLIDGRLWLNDESVEQVPNRFGGHDGLLKV